MSFSTGNDRFNAEAAAWDSNPNVVLASALALSSLLSHFPQLRADTANKLDVLEIGCGTGLLSLSIAPYVRSLVAVDAAPGMISAFNAKLSSDQKEVKNVTPVCALLTNPDDERIGIDPVSGERVLGRRFDLIVSHLVLHHIADLSEVFKTMEGCLKLGGSVALTDYEDFGPEARRFHAEARMEGVERHGIQRAEVQRLLSNAGFVDVHLAKAFEMEKWVEKVPGGGVIKGEGGVKMTFPFLICMGKKA